MRRLGGLTALYALVATLALAGPTAVSEEPGQPADPAATTTAAPAPAASAPAASAPAASAPATSTPSASAPAASAPSATAPSTATPTTASAQPVLEDKAPADAGKAKNKVIAIAAASAGVTISDFKFAPGNVTVNVGDTVTWSNSGPTGHSATATNGSFDTGVLAKGTSGSHTFDQAGTFSYYCKPHPFMKGTITVVAAAAQNGSGNSSSGSSGSSGTSGSTGSSGSAPSSGPSLPTTGFDVGGIVVLGLTTLAMGAYLRRRTAIESPRPAGRIGW